MEHEFHCPACGSTHNDPAEARLGHRVTCLDCSLGDEFDLTIVISAESDEIAALAA